MSNITNTMTTATQSAFAMPVYGRAYGNSACAIEGIDVRVRGSHVTASLKGAFPGTIAWRPPNC